MKLYSSAKTLKTAALLCGAGLAVSMLAHRANADEWNKKTILTVDQPIQISDTYLDAGTYVLRLADSSSDRHIVYIYNDKENHLYNTVLAYPNYRVRPTGNTRFTFWETPSGSPRALRDWFYPGDNFGQEFPYPKHLRTVAAVTAVPAPPAPPAPAPAPEPQAVQPETPAPQAPVAETVPEQQEQEIAQNTPPPAPPAPPVEAAPPPQAPEAPAPAELPQTASPFPAIGLAGLFSLALYGFSRIKRTA